MREPELTTNEASVKVDAYAHAPRVTEESIKAKIKNTVYLYDRLTTICIITMQNGFKVIGHSTPASSANYMSDVGQRYAYDNAFKQLWQFEGYLLRQMLYEDELRGYQGGY